LFLSEQLRMQFSRPRAPKTYAKKIVRRNIELSLVLTFGLLWPQRVHAESFSLSYHGPSNCPGQSSLLEQVLARTVSAKDVGTGGEFQFDAQVKVNDDGTVVGTLGIRSANGYSSSRSVDGKTCEEVVSALALIVGLTLEPKAHLKPDESPTAHSDHAGPPEAVVAERLNHGNASDADSPRDRTHAVDTATPVSPPPNTWPRGNTGAAAQTQPRLLTALAQPAPIGSQLPQTSWQLGIGAQVEWLSSLARSGGMALLGVRAEIGNNAGPSLTLVGTFGPNVRRKDDIGVAVESDYLGGGLEIGYRLGGNQRAGVDAVAIASAG